MKITKEQYNTLLQKGLTAGEIASIASSKGYDLPSTKSGLQKASDVVGTIFPGKKVGEAIGTLAGYGLSKNKEFYDTSAPTPLQVAGDIAGGALTVGSMGGAGTVGKLGTRVAKSAILGAGLSGAQSIAEKKPAEKVIGSAIAGGALGGALPVVGAGLSAIKNQISKLPARFINSAVGRTKQQVLQDISKDKVDDLSKYVLSTKKIGTAEKLVRESALELDKLNSNISNTLKTSNVPVKTKSILTDVSSLPEAEGALLDDNGIKKIVTQLAPQTKQLLSKETLTLSEANKLRQLVDKTLGDRAFLGGQLSSDKIILKKFADTLRETVKSKAPDGTRQLFADYANEIRFNQGLLGKIAQKQGNQVLSFGDFIGGGLGGVFGGGIGGAVAGVAARRVIESVPFKMTMAVSSQKISDALLKAKPVIEQLTPAQRTVILKMFSEILSGEESTTE